MNRFSKFNDHDGNLKVIKFLTQFGSNIYNRTQSFIIIINLNDTDWHVAYLFSKYYADRLLIKSKAFNVKCDNRNIRSPLERIYMTFFLHL